MSRKIRYGVVGLGWIAQAAMLPAFQNASENSELTALVSDDPVKRRALSGKYDVPYSFDYGEFDDCLNAVDAIYIALPNNQHREYTERAAQAGVHVLCEKPMAPTVADAQAMIAAAEQHRIKLMIAYRLHLETANLEAITIANSGQLGDVRFFHAINTQVVEAGNIRLDPKLGGGPLDDIGIYCINAARYIFQDEPIEAFAMSTHDGDPKFDQVPEMVCGILRFPGDRIASFTCGFSTAKISQYQIGGTNGDLRVDPAFGFESDLRHVLTINDQTTERVFPRRDQFGAQLVYFSNCILNDQQPEPDGYEGLIDLQIIEALRESTKTGSRVLLEGLQKSARPHLEMELAYPAIKAPELVNAADPKGNSDGE
ncbi:MAG: Gfo/Idh/MocA family oxidoreductase [Anaerolineae bacterium]|jgi:glucose-fructose oxidoreductase|nr:Gfo/Idh/MocA family oxidoreductase [Anaerolineae bacterium]